MTDEAINKAIAEFDGYKSVVFNKGWKGWIFARNSEVQVNIPDYCNDSNAMAKAKSLLTGDKRREFIDYLYEIVREVVKQDKNINAGPYSVMIEAFYATAKQQAIAFVKTIGKWKK